VTVALPAPPGPFWQQPSPPACLAARGPSNACRRPAGARRSGPARLF